MVLGNDRSLCHFWYPIGVNFRSGTLFVLFLNNITEEIDAKTNVLMYAGDTKIWHEISSKDDHHVLQRDIDSILDWGIKKLDEIPSF